MIELNVRAKKLEWGDALTPKQALEEYNKGAQICVAEKDELGFIHPIETLRPTFDYTEEKIAKYLKHPERTLRKNLIKKGMVYRHVLMKTGQGLPYAKTIYAATKEELSAKIKNYKDAENIFDMLEGMGGGSYMWVPVETVIF